MLPWQDSGQCQSSTVLEGWAALQTAWKQGWTMQCQEREIQFGVTRVPVTASAQLVDTSTPAHWLI